MEIVIDSSSVLAVLVEEPHRDAIVRATRGASLVAPVTLDAEIGNALSAMFKRRRIDLARAMEVLRQYREIVIERVEVDLAASVSLAHDLGIYAYDGYMIECARRLRSPILSLDSGLKKAARSIDLEVLELEL